MSDFDRLKDQLSDKVLLAAGKQALQKAVRSATLSEEEQAKAEAEEQALAKKRRTKWLVYGVLGLFLAIGVIGLLLTYWAYFLGAGVLGIAGLFAYYRWSARQKSRKEELRAGEEQAAEAAQQERTLELAAVDEAQAKRAREAAASAEREVAALRAEQQREAKAVAEQEIDDELAALKRRVKS